MFNAASRTQIKKIWDCGECTYLDVRLDICHLTTTVLSCLYTCLKREGYKKGFHLVAVNRILHSRPCVDHVIKNVLFIVINII